MNIVKRFKKTTTECAHNWRYAGPVVRLSDILQDIEGLEFKWGTFYLEVLIDGKKYYDPTCGSGYEHYNDKIQGSVCIKCGECIDNVELRRLHWIAVRDKIREAYEKAALEEKMAEDLWNACPKRRK